MKTRVKVLLQDLAIVVGIFALAIGFGVGIGKAVAAPNAMVIAPSVQPPGSGVGQVYPTYAPLAPRYNDDIVLTGSAAVTQAVPTGSRVVIFSSTCNFWAKPGATATVPSSTTTDGTGAQLNPTQWLLSVADPITQITVNADVACKMSITFYL